MKRWIGLALLIFVGAAGWRVGDALSPDALSMAIGVFFGVLAGVPTALLVMAGSRRRHSEERSVENPAREARQQLMYPYGQAQGQGAMHGWGMQPYAQQPPIIVVAGPQGFGGQQPPQPQAGWLPQEPPARNFTVVGSGEELTEDW